MTQYRVTWVDTKSGEAQGVDVRTLRTADNMARSLARAKDTRDITVSMFRPSSFNELSLRYSR